MSKYKRTTSSQKRLSCCASITQSSRKPKTREVVNDREERDDEADTQAAMWVTEVIQPGVDNEARRIRKGGQSVFGYK